MVKIWGEGYDQIIWSTVRMIGPDDTNMIAPIGSNLTEDHLIVKFSKKEALSIISEPKPGDEHDILITDDPSGLGIFSKICHIEIVGKKN